MLLHMSLTGFSACHSQVAQTALPSRRQRGCAAFGGCGQRTQLTRPSCAACECLNVLLCAVYTFFHQLSSVSASPSRKLSAHSSAPDKSPQPQSQSPSPP
eukprot:TRINITY_DN6586_c0_g1_i1.p1 TRINITY_DN6586_c0_g1~~TRINITY_DN6586_c0_g1_i1.p1  ORF type:complete len:100 (+),score=3.41 TRINITY_DN6586_c0_g1_i1:410-709(+)